MREGIPGPALASARTSENFHTLKTASILVVALGHFVQPVFPLIWFPVALTLLAFAYSSAYFTFLSHGERFAAAPYWRRKVLRLGPSLLVIDLFLIVLAWSRGDHDIASWQALASLAGLGGFLNWFHIQNPSPFGSGTWFFTLLLLFYAVYPWLVLVYAARLRCLIFLVSSCAALFFLNRTVSYGHALWLTIFGFLLGIAVAKYPSRPSQTVLLVALAVVLVLTATANRAGFKSLNFLFLIGIFLPFVVLWQHAFVPGWVHRVFAPLRGCLLEIYLIHTSLFVHPTGLLFVDFLISLAVILVTARGLAFAAGGLRRALTARVVG